MNHKTRKLSRKIRVSSKVKSVARRPRLHVVRSNKHVYVQIIGGGGKIIASACDVGLKGTKTQKALEVGKIIAGKALKQKVDRIAFDRGAYKFHGRVKAIASGARDAGLQF
ncbi:50S ribosomal protein L18 [Microgenomates group bacterium RIFCSPLOWO2_01_FULL_47_10]|nr:ribosomal protein L18 [uncultured bacterium]OGV92385.1 MAG: 50S ribosomal protein L18 [Microgenomates group bacterium RIFCSPLOWO2_01_FULL_47_10]